MSRDGERKKNENRQVISSIPREESIRIPELQVTDKSDVSGRINLKQFSNYLVRPQLVFDLSPIRDSHDQQHSDPGADGH